MADQPTLPESAAVEEPTVPVKVESTAADRKQKPDASDATPAPAEERACEEAPLAEEAAEAEEAAQAEESAGDEVTPTTATEETVALTDQDSAADPSTQAEPADDAQAPTPARPDGAELIEIGPDDAAEPAAAGTTEPAGSGTEQVTADAAKTEAAPTEAAPTEAAPTEAAPEDAAPEDAAPEDAAPEDAEPPSDRQGPDAEPKTQVETTAAETGAEPYTVAGTPTARSRVLALTVVAALVAVLVAAVIAIVYVVGGSDKGSGADDHSLRAKRGDCLLGESEKELKRVGCSNPDARWTVVGVTDNKTESDAKNQACAQWPEAEASYWESRNGKTGFVLCLASVLGK